MSRGDFYDENKYTSYPFIRSSVRTVADTTVAPATLKDLFPSWIVDARFTFYPRCDFDPGEHSVRLQEISRTMDTLSFVFSCDAPTLAGSTLVFQRELGGADFELETVESETYSQEFPGSDSNSESSDCEDPLWEGTLVTGEVDALFDLLSSGESIPGEAGKALVEPSLLISLKDAWVESLNVANQDRARVYDDACEDFPWQHDPNVPSVVAQCLQNEVDFESGYNVEVVQRTIDNALVFLPGIGRGAGSPCGEVQWFENEEPPNENTTLYSGSFLCDDVIRTINGLGGPVVQLRNRQGITITEQPLDNKIIINADLHGLSVCLDDVVF